MLETVRVAPVPFFRDSERRWLRGFKWPNVLSVLRAGRFLVLLDIFWCVRTPSGI